MIQPRFRSEYAGEFVITGTTFRDGVKIQSREWIDNPIINQHVSGRAAILISDVDRHRFDYAKLQHHHGGLRGSKRLQTYGTGVTWQHLPLNFYVSTDTETLQAITTKNYDEHTVVYSDRRRVLQNPGRFYLVPYCPLVSDAALAMYLAAFDGHREIFVLGALGHVSKNTAWHQHIALVMRTYTECVFWFIGIETTMPESWRQLANFKSMRYRPFISYCDI